mmetsp:Transcript_11785/g.50499  ORF Transcript_11785/g.50499 Transcript_11785/m.50499 type:complete len:250 (+) Transcript_11785:1239-1988(+)
MSASHTETSEVMAAAAADVRAARSASASSLYEVDAFNSPAAALKARAPGPEGPAPALTSASAALSSQTSSSAFDAVPFAFESPRNDVFSSLRISSAAARALGGVRALVANARIQAYTASRAAATSALSVRVVDSKSPCAFAEAETPRAARRTRLNASEKFSFVFVSRVVSAFTEAAAASASVASRALARSAGTTSNDQPLCSRASRVFASKSNIAFADAPLFANARAAAFEPEEKKASNDAPLFFRDPS